MGTRECVRLASIGVGLWGKRLAEGVQASGLAKIVTCFAPTRAHCEEFAQRFGCDVSPSYEVILADPEIDGVLLTTPNSLHRGQVEAAALQGKHVFVEKPIALTVADGLTVTRLCAQAGVVLAVGHQLRRQAAIRRLKSLIEANELGQVIGVEANISTSTGLHQEPNHWRWSREQCPGGPLIQIGIHHVDTLCYLLGPIVRVGSLQRRLLAPAEFADATVTLLEFESGVIGTLTSHYVTARTFDIRVIGTSANARYDRLLGLEIRRDTSDRAIRESLPIPDNNPICEEMTEFAQCIRTGERPEVGGEEATFALAVVLAAIKSATHGQTMVVRDLFGTKLQNWRKG